MSICLGMYGEWISVEILNFYMALTHEMEQILSWTFYVNIDIYIYNFSVGINSLLRTFCSISVGRKNL